MSPASKEHIEFITFILGYYGKSLSNVTCIIGDNCSVNKSMSTKLGLPVIGCASHRFNLAVSDIISGDQKIVYQAQELMFKLKTLVQSAKLRKPTPLRSKIRNFTR